MENELLTWMLRWGLAGTTLLTAVALLVRHRSAAGSSPSLAIVRLTILLSLALPVAAAVPPAISWPVEAAARHSVTPPGAGLAPPDRTKEDAGRMQVSVEPEAISRAGGDRAAALRVSPAWVVFLVWMAGATGLLGTYTASAFRLARAFRSGRAYDGGPIGIACRMADGVDGPVLFGLIAPKLLLPADFGEWPASERRSALAHEQQHRLRHDLWWSFAGTLMAAVHWWLPSARLLNRQHEALTEEACDRDAVAGGTDRSEYARALIAFGRRLRGRHAAGLAMIGGGSLRRRLERITDPIEGRSTGRATAAAMFVSMALSVGIAAAGPGMATVQPTTPLAASSDEEACRCTDDPPFVRRWAVAPLTNAARNDREELLRLARSGDDAIRAAAIQALGDWPVPEARDAVRAGLDDPAPGVRAEAVMALARNPGQDVDLVVAALDSPDCRVAAAAAAAMADLRAAQGLPRLATALRGGSCLERRSAAEGLAGYRDTESASALRSAMDDPDRRVRQAAADSLAQVGDGSAITRLVAALEEDESKHVRQSAAAALGRLAQRGDASVIGALRTAAADPNAHIRYEALESLSRLGDGRLEPLFVARLDDENDVVRAAAAEGLGRLGSTSALPALLRLSREDPNEVVRAAAIDTLSHLTQ